MTKNKLINDASESIGAIIYQYYIALDKCFELSANESIFIEKFGDVSSHTQQIEVKHYSDKLTDSHINFWKTVNNWLVTTFDYTQFKHLILLTTQDFGTNTHLEKWNDATDIERINILNTIKKDTEIRHNTAKSKNNSKEKPKTLKLMESVLASESLERLNQIIPKIIIANATPISHEYYEMIKSKYLKGIPLNNKNLVMDTMLGFLISPEIKENSYKITYEVFSKQVEEVTAQYNSTTIIFPKRFLNEKIEEAERKEHINEIYIKKILDIEYKDAIPDAITHYVVTNKTIAEELMNRISNKQVYSAYQQEIIHQIKPKYASACRNAKEETLINQSKDYYDNIMGLSSPAFGSYNDTPTIFKNGMIHILANDDSNVITWKLKLEK